MRLSIRLRLLLFSIVLILAGVSITGGIALYIQINTLEENHRHFGEELAEIIGKNVQDPLHNLETHKLRAQLHTLVNNDDFARTLILDTEGVILTDGTEENLLQEEKLAELTPALEQLQQRTDPILIWEINNHIAITHRIVTPFGEFLGFIHLELSRAYIDDSIKSAFQQFLLLEGLLLLFSIIASLLLSNYFHRPLKEAVSSANAIAAGNYHIPTCQRHDEFGDLSRTLQQMAEQIEKTINTLNETQLEQEEIFRSMADGVLVVDRNNTILKVNERLELLSQQFDNTLVGQPLSNLLGEEITLSDFYGEGIQKSLIRPNDEVPVQVSGALIHPPHLDHAIGLVLIIHDLSDRLRAESQEQYAAFQAGIAEMGASVLHNIGNVITGMTGHILKLQSRTRPLDKLLPALSQYADESEQIAQQGGSADAIQARLHDTAKILKSSTESFTRIHQQFDSLDKLESGIRHIGDIISIQQSASRPVLTAAPFKLKSLVEDTYSLIDERLSKYSITWHTELSPEVSSVQLPRNPLMQLLLNLIKNSLEAIITEMLDNSTLEGTITLAIHPLDQHQFTLSIHDNGCGISEEQLEQIFTSRYTTKSSGSGSGYGLHSAINFVRQIDGKIIAESDGPHHGTTITLTLPRELNEQPSSNDE